MPGHFTKEQQDEIREQLFHAGILYLKKYGVQKMTVDKLAATVGIAKGSFYNFYESKEEFLFALTEYADGKIEEMLNRKLNGREKMPVSEFMDFLNEYLHSDYDLLANLKVDDFLWIQKHLENYNLFEPNSQSDSAKYWMSKIQNVNEKADPGVFVNLLKCIYAIREHRDTMVKESLDESINVLLQAIEYYLLNGYSKKRN